MDGKPTALRVHHEISQNTGILGCMQSLNFEYHQEQTHHHAYKAHLVAAHVCLGVILPGYTSLNLKDCLVA